MKSVSVTIEGVAALLINRFKDESEVQAAAGNVAKKGKKDYGTPRQQAEKTAYYDEETKKLWVPSTWITGSIATVASDYKLKNSKKSVKSVSGGAIIPYEEKIYFKEGFTLADVEIDSRPCVVQRARIMRHRSKLEFWTLEFNLMIDDSILPLETVKELLDDAGKRAGLGDYRPPKGGQFGRYTVTKWEVLAKEPPQRVRKPRKTSSLAEAPAMQM